MSEQEGRQTLEKDVGRSTPEAASRHNLHQNLSLPSKQPTSPPCMQCAALALAELGLAVIRLGSRPDGFKRPAMGATWAGRETTDPMLIRRWWSGIHRDANVGLVTGPVSGIWVLDIDISPSVSGYQSLTELVANHGRLPTMPVVTTPSGGSHLFFGWDASNPVRSTASRLPGLDSRGPRGYVVGPHSRHEDYRGQRYRWQPGRDPLSVQRETGVMFPLAPRWLTDLFGDQDRPARRSSPSPRNGQLATTSDFSDFSMAIDELFGCLAANGLNPIGTNAFCPIHEDRRSRSMSFAIGTNGRPIFYCHGPCSSMPPREFFARVTEAIPCLAGGVR